MFDVETLRAAIAAHGTVARVVIASVEGSSPREVGASMLVWADGQSGTIGGGALEWQAVANARALPRTRLDRVPLGPALGQCCGGAVTLLTETYGAEATAPSSAAISSQQRDARSPSWHLDLFSSLPDDIFARPVDGRPMPLAVKRLLGRARSQGIAPAPTLLQGWFIEPLARPTRNLWIWGAGHVGRAVVNVMAPLPDLAITWVDTSPDRFPSDFPGNVTALPAADPAALVPHAPETADHLILTYSHALDLELCHRLLTHGFATAGLIGSATKWARFRSRLAALGHTAPAISRIACPIGDPALGKHPQAIAIGVAAAFLNPARIAARQEIAG